MIKVLVVDDDQGILEVVNVILGIHGFLVETVVNCRSVFDEVRKFCPDVILLDVNLSPCDGREICKQLKSPPSSYQDIPVILFSAMKELEKIYLDCHASDFISKPFEVNALVQILTRYGSHAA